MSTITIELARQSCPVHIGNGLLGDSSWMQLPAKSQAVLVADAAAYKHHGALLQDTLANALGSQVPVYEVAFAEQSKSFSELEKLLGFFAENKISRLDTVVALGGGVATDLAGFAAAIWLRGVRYVSCPSTLLAMVDASVGGKTGINLASGKNLVGSFHQPAAVCSDVATLATLPRRELHAGYAEVVKHGILQPSLLEFVDSNSDALADGVIADPQLLGELVLQNVECKAAVVSEDERESGVRAHLNLGHTFAHALESALGYGRLLHGEAVAIGLVAACSLAKRIKLAEVDLQPQVEKILEKLELPTRFPSYDKEKFNRAMALDKKVASGSLRFVLPAAAGRIRIVSDVPAEAVQETMRELAQ